MVDVQFTQYMRPNGRRFPVFIVRPDTLAEKVAAILERGHRFECELLQTGQVSLTIFDPVREEDVDGELVANGANVPAAVDRLIERNG